MPSLQYTHPPVSCQVNSERTEERSEEHVELDISMLSTGPPSDKKDISFQPLSSISTSAPSAEHEEREMLWKTNKWIVNEPNIMELFKRCQECGLLITETRKTTVGSLLRVHWKCGQQHKGQWSSCTDVRGMTANNLPVSACTLSTGATFTHINDRATMLNLKTPKKSSYHDIQSSYLIPVINEEYQEQQKSLINDLHLSIYRSSIHLSIYLSIYRSSIHLSIYLSVYNLPICLSIYLSVCLSVYLSIYLSISLPIYLLPIYLSVYHLSIYLSIYLSIIYLSIYLFIYLSIYLCRLSIYISTYLYSAYLSIYLSVYHLSIYLSIYHLPFYICIYLSIYLSTYLSSAYLSIYLSVYRSSIHLSIYLSIYLSICI
ncbi:uncharacterized protein LOC131550775 isoform X2 [Onychostoma macrolepis]|uniref:uncharacterized protein LOC131550775 isoform X2 n=1 Tax=Onychostoma macrolepis TaxID=369639 RepID=UPI00272D92E7|nr:uncharacterized protein LOC131550775 isoform X2 [Onychostoma macrolepis]